MQIVQERPGDETAIRAVTQAAFIGLPHSQQTEAAIIDALRAADALTISLVALDDSALVGHVAFSPVMIDGADRGWFGLGPVSVAPERQRDGIGSRLIRHGLEQLKADGARGCVVLGDPEYYRRFGFEPNPDLKYPHAPSEYFQALAFHDENPLGEVEYHAGFNAT
ncbi:N-acetyltransferase [Sphingobium sp. BYY-5]|uniref:GNAT family N-acetyltransferase n=1 Tax=Sphingobium sp. BYY-5 TaxID=2926400 RepID=UPI001FA75D87|nr:N-acetyltransferase [Sphingobium sp. BYY-5]MCI4590523.1 N-acetyltransferase [Sphingobium sp. BYY-5]